MEEQRSIEERVEAMMPLHMVVATLGMFVALLVAMGFAALDYKIIPLVLAVVTGVPYLVLLVREVIDRENRYDELKAEELREAVESLCGPLRRIIDLRQQNIELERRNLKLQGDLDALHYIARLMEKLAG